jgi:hypothetical protein
MPRTPMAAALCIGLLAVACSPGRAQPVSTDEDRTVRPGDRIEWSGPAPHRVQFGGSVGTPPVVLTPLADIDKVITFSSPLNISDDTGTSKVGGMPMLTATVKDDAATSGVAAFMFTCGRHPVDMKSLPIKIAANTGQAPRTLKIKAVGLNWLLEKAGGDVKVNKP